jgi:RNase P/RNase MRP subunit p30
MIETTNIEKAKKLIKDCKEAKIVVIAQDDEFNRKILEYGKFHVLLGVEKGQRKDSLRQIDSGFNHVLANIAVKKQVALGLDMNEISHLQKKEKAILLEKVKQNVKICRRAGVRIVLLNYKDRKDAFSFLVSLGGSTLQAKEAISF